MPALLTVTLNLPVGGDIAMTTDQQLQINITDDCDWSYTDGKALFPHGLLGNGRHRRNDPPNSPFGPPAKKGTVTYSVAPASPKESPFTGYTITVSSGNIEKHKKKS